MKLHLGCGKKYLSGYIHVDIIKYPNVDIQADIRNLDSIPNNSVDEIYACHVLEHFNRKEIIQVLTEWNKKLKVNGILRLAVPDFEAIVKEYNEHKNLHLLQGLLVGGQRDKYDYHTFVFDFTLIKDILEGCGFRNVERYDWRYFLPNDYDDYSRVYLPHMDFDNGKLLSLNVTANKCNEEQTININVKQATGEQRMY